MKLPDHFKISEDGGESYFSIDGRILDEFRERMASKGRVLEIGEPLPECLGEFVLPVLALKRDAPQALLKSALHAAAVEVVAWDREGSGAEEVRRALTDSRYRVGRDWISWDYGSPDFSAAPFYHGYEVTACAETKTIAARVHVYGLVRLRCVLSERYSGSEHFTQSVTRDPLSGSDRRDDFSCAHPIPWLFGLNRTPFPTRQAAAYFRAHRHLLRPQDWDDRLEQPTAGI